MTTEDKTPDNVFTFRAKGEDRLTPVKQVPSWAVTYVINNDTRQTDIVSGFITSMYPSFIVSSTEELKDINKAEFGIPADRLIKFVKAENAKEETEVSV